MPTPDWPFDQTADTAVITTRQVLDDNKPILNVGHDEEDDSWTFVCGTTDDLEDKSTSVAVTEIDRLINRFMDK